MDVAIYDPANGKLWVNIIMQGMYGIVYTYQLLDRDGTTPLTNPLKQGDNSTADNHYQIINDNKPGDVLEAYDGRQVYVSFNITKMPDDNGYTLYVNILQGNDYASAAKIGGTQVQSSVGGGNSKNEDVFIKLQKG